MDIKIIDQPYSAFDAVQSIHNDNDNDDPFYVMDVGDLIRKFERWVVKLPTVKPFYAVKCNDSAVVLEVLAYLGTGFDCSSKWEIDQVLKLKNVEPDRIVFANPTKMLSHIKHSSRVGVNLMTFDNVTELRKIKRYHPTAKLLLRLRCQPAKAQRTLDGKFGCEEEKCEGLLRTAVELNLSVVGVSFHIGSGCFEPAAYSRAMLLSKRVMNVAKSLGIMMTVLDIGGGFTGHLFDEVADEINKCLEKEFCDLKDLEVMAEPGRYFVFNAFTLATTIHSKREDEESAAKYYLNDGVYGSFNITIFDRAVVTPKPLKVRDKGKPSTCSIWGPTCDSIDLISKDAILPNMDVGDVLLFPNMGAYTSTVSTTFSGHPIPKIHYFIQDNYLQQLNGLVFETSLETAR